VFVFVLGCLLGFRAGRVFITVVYVFWILWCSHVDLGCFFFCGVRDVWVFFCWFFGGGFGLGLVVIGGGVVLL